MARLHEYEGKALLARHGIRIPKGRAVTSGREAFDAYMELPVSRSGGEVVLKMQAWTTSRAAQGGIVFSNAADKTKEDAEAMLNRTIGGFPVTHVLVEEKLDIASPVFVSFSIDDRARQPVLLLALGGGTGIEERAESVKRIPCSVESGPDAALLRTTVEAFDVKPESKPALVDAILKAFETFRASEARSLEINPLVVTRSGDVVAADCRITIDDYAVVRHPELGIEIARELDHPPTVLERLAYAVEQKDHRGTFFFAQMNAQAEREPGLDSENRGTQDRNQNQRTGLIGFHGAGGGGSMMSMDAITAEGFTIANFCDTSGNPSPAKVYRAARIILEQPGLVGYFGSGSGVANQEQFWSAYGLAKAFWEMDLDIPAVIRLGGNTEDRAVDILQGACRAAGLKATVEAYRKTDTPAKIAARFAMLVREANGKAWTPRPPRRPAFVNSPTAHRFDLKGGTLWIDPVAWKSHATAIIARSNGLLADSNGIPSLRVTPAELATKDSDLIACEVECRRDGIQGFFVTLDLPG